MYWIEDLLDPWENYGHLTHNASVHFKSDNNGEWQTQSSSFVVEEGSAVVGKYFATWIQIQNNTGHIVVGEASLHSVPEPYIIALFGLGLLGQVLRVAVKFNRSSLESGSIPSCQRVKYNPRTETISFEVAFS